ncbi:stage II sporulation protein D [Paenibacillus sp. yr247]|uniref:SpoIID/LytB domain-containing protein n=1 Tax=Paenibacillus sp. yr247 TaxID=1761880 RepID=UPI0008892F6C|nr:SpoIID/LytB domain-containing protein [Paenibacillus sp. yr247]SDN55765.1 stage II sporulation protein D [Paenibacillus sp. yr247]
MKWTKKLLTPNTMAFITTAVLTFGTFPVMEPHAYAEGIKHLDQIRVALFIDSSKYKLVEPAVTLSASDGMDIGVRSSAGTLVKPWLSIPESSIRLSLDQYSVILLETTDFAAAKALHAKLATLPGDGYVLSRVKQGRTVYQVFYGSFPSKEAAEGAGAQALKDTTVASLTKSAPPVLTGPLHWSAGTYATEAAALQQLDVYTQSGLQADLALQEDLTGQLVYSVWVGSEATAGQLEAVKQTALRVAPSISLQAVNTKSSYLVRRSDVTSSSNGTVSVPHYAAAAGEQRTLVHSKGEGIAIQERADRRYRGDMEISTYHDKLALVNEVAMEQYLYAVLGSELSSVWPIEALKAQAVAARTFAIKQGNKYEIAQVTDTTLDQAYFGMQKEFAAGTQAVDATKDEVLSDNNGLISPVFSSNSGGMTADPSEVWGNPVAYLRSVPSPDEGAEKGKATWYRIQLADGRAGYVHHMYLKDSGQKEKEGASYYEATEQGVNVRRAPYVDNIVNPSIAQLSVKEKVLVLGEEKESNAYSWIRGPYTASDIKSKLTAAGVAVSGDLQSLEISKRGPSGRVTELKANGMVVKVQYPDALRSALGGLPSTRFEIEEAGSYTGNNSITVSLAIVGAAATETSSAGSDPVYVLSGGQSVPTALKKADIMALGTAGLSKPADTPVTHVPPPSGQTAGQGKQFVFRGTGYGHGLGMSQWGARGYAELGYDYKKILQTYYAGVNITKE